MRNLHVQVPEDIPPYHQVYAQYAEPQPGCDLQYQADQSPLDLLLHRGVEEQRLLFDGSMTFHELTVWNLSPTLCPAGLI